MRLLHSWWNLLPWFIIKHTLPKRGRTWLALRKDAQCHVGKYEAIRCEVGALLQGIIDLYRLLEGTFTTTTMVIARCFFISCLLSVDVALLLEHIVIMHDCSWTALATLKLPLNGPRDLGCFLLINQILSLLNPLSLDYWDVIITFRLDSRGPPSWRDRPIGVMVICIASNTAHQNVIEQLNWVHLLLLLLNILM